MPTGIPPGCRSASVEYATWWLLLSETPLFDVSDSELHVLATRHGLERLYLVADIAAEIWRHERKEVRNPGGYLHSLCTSLITPVWYQPPEKRNANAEEAEKRKRAVRELAENEKAVEEQMTQEKDALWSSLSDADRECFRAEVTVSMAPGFHWPAMAITALAKTMAWERRLTMSTNGAIDGAALVSKCNHESRHQKSGPKGHPKGNQSERGKYR